MALFRFDNIVISGISCAVPKNKVLVDSFKPLFGDEDVEKFKSMTGVTESRRTIEHQTVSDLGYTAAVYLLNKKNIDKSEIGALVFASHSPDYRRPSTAHILHKRLGLSTETVVFDISLGCSSLVYGIQAVSSLMSCSDVNKALLIVGDTAGKSVYPTDKSAVMLFGEAGGAVLLEKKSNVTPISAMLRSDGNGYQYMIIPAGGYRNLNAPATPFMCPDGIERTLYNSILQGTSVFTFTIFDVPRILKDFCKATNTSIADYDCFAFHQANLYILKQIAKKMKIPMDKMPLTLEKYGNTSGASALMSLCDVYGSVQNGKLNTLFCGFGIGLSWGVFSAQLNVADIFPIIEDDSIFEEGVINNPDVLFKKIL